MKVLVVGAGVVGLAVARSAALLGHEVVVAEAGQAIGGGISSRNSEVVHAGMYYPADSLRATHCVAGRRMLYNFCLSHGVPFKKCGKLIVATRPEQIEMLEGLLNRGRANDVEGLKLMEGRDARALEPALTCVAALSSSETGIVDGARFMLALQGDLEDAGGAIAFNAPIEQMEPFADGWRVHVGGGHPTALAFDGVVNCAGLGAQALASHCQFYPKERIPRLFMAKGNYFSYVRTPVFARLIYPVPVDGGLGVHVTIDLAGRMRLGPDVEWVERESYEVDANRAAAFYDSVRGYWPELEDGALAPDYAGVRPKLTGPGEAPADFVIDGPTHHGLRGLVHFFGIESPGLTSAMSLAEEAMRQLEM